MVKYKQKPRTNQGTGLIISLISALANGESFHIITFKGS